MEPHSFVNVPDNAAREHLGKPMLMQILNRYGLHGVKLITSDDHNGLKSTFGKTDVNADFKPL